MFGKLCIALMYNTTPSAIIVGPRAGDVYIRAWEGYINSNDERPVGVLPILYHALNMGKLPAALVRRLQNGDVVNINWCSSWVLEDLKFRQLPDVIQPGRYIPPVEFTRMPTVKLLTPEAFGVRLKLRSLQNDRNVLISGV